MTDFRTSIAPEHFPFRIHHHSPTLCIGSCFAKHIGKRMELYKFPCLSNPLGIVYNPISIAQQLETIVQKGSTLHSAQLFEHQGLWHHFLFHGSFSSADKEAMLSTLIAQSVRSRSILQAAGTLFITLGTARVYIHKQSRAVVANCHKVPADRFDRKLLSVEASTNVLSGIFEKLKKLNPSLEIVLTVSPIRHLRDGLVENQQSKSTLLVACTQLCQAFDYVYYFPAWEIMMDDLRDYRFYEADMIHPSLTAINYIWDYFKAGFFGEDTLQLLPLIDKVVRAAQHRPFRSASETHQAFLQKQLEEIAKLEQQYPFLDFAKERNVLKAQMV
ncbi:MAG TPA: GSCFA domain protein [Phaeodactylibacter sp.]|nr:GSCFA domain protein [Phaeodactylibacter sp.]